MSARRARAGHAEVTASIRDNISGGLRKIKAKMNQFARSSAALGRSIGGLGASGILGGALLVNKFAAFDDQMRTAKGVTSATTAEFEKLRAKARELGANTSFMASEVAGGMVELGRAKFNSDEIDASAESVLNLARATGTELPSAALFGAKILGAFGLDATEMGRVADVLSVTANSSSQTLEDLFEALKLIGPAAVRAGDPIEEMAAAVGVLANSGITGSLAGNAIARAYKNLANSGMQDRLRELTGVEAVDAAGNLRPLVEIITDIGHATRDFGEAAKLDAFEQLFGRGQTAALTLATANNGFDNLLDKLKNAEGAAKKTADEMDAGIGGSVRRLGSAIEGVALTLGDQLAPTFEIAAEGAGYASGKIQEFFEQNQSIIPTLLAVAGGLTVAGGLLIGLSLAATAASTAIGLITGTVGLITGVLSVMGTAFGMIAAFANPIGLTTIAVVAGAAALVYYSGVGGDAINYLNGVLGDLWTWADTVFDGIFAAIKDGNWDLAVEIAWAAAGVAWQKGLDDLYRQLILWRRGVMTILEEVGHASLSVATGGLYGVYDTASGNQNERLRGAAIEAFNETNEVDANSNAIALQEKLDDLLDQAKEQTDAAKDAVSPEARKPPEPTDPPTAPEPPQISKADVESLRSNGITGSLDLQSLFEAANKRDLEEQILEANQRTADAAEDTVDRLERIKTSGNGLVVTP